jgi:hypothetical protein
MRTVTGSRTVVVVGRRPPRSAADLLGDVRPGGEVAVFVLGLDPTPAQRRLTDEALMIAAERRLELSAELMPAPSWLRDRLREGDEVRVAVRPREARRWRVGPGTIVSASGA